MWDHPNPIFLDFETQSAADIKETGGRLYAFHPSTRILILSAYVDGTFHVWIPDHIRADISSWNPARMWPHGLDKPQTVVLHRGDDIPPEILHPSAERPLVAHNAYGFDRFIWERFIGTDAVWLDSLILAKSSGRPGRLDALGKAILGQGKDRAAKLMPELCMGVERCVDDPFGGNDGWRYPLIRTGDLQAFTTYAIADVEILRRLWNEFDYLSVEEDVVRVHDNINNRGILVDSDLLFTIQRLSRYSVSTAVSEITEITDGRINANNLRSTKQIHEWLSEYGISLTDNEGKPCLRKDVVQRYIDSPYLIESNLNSAKEIPPFIIDVLRLRMKALRITDAKVNRAIERISPDGRIRDLHTYGTAHTGRFSSSGIQIHNLPRPLKGIKTEECVNVFELCKQDKDIDRVYKRVKELIPKPSKPDEKITLTVDDICSAMIRPTFIAKDKMMFAICDYSTVEARGAAWCADEHKMLQSFKEGRDLYKEFAMKVFNKESIEQVTKDERQVAKSAVLGCQYGLGAEKFRVYAAANGADLQAAGVTAEQCIDTYRDTYTKICGFRPNRSQNFRTGGIWHILNDTVKKVIEERNPLSAGKCTWYLERGNLCCQLPSGRVMYYPEVRIEDVIPPYCYTLNLPLVPKATVVYTSPHGTKSLYGGLLLENIVQAICRDLLACALVQLENLGLNPVLHVHDEIVCEVSEFDSIKALHQMVRIMSTAPSWADGFPLACEGFLSKRFVKERFEGFAHLNSKELTNARISV